MKTVEQIIEEILNQMPKTKDVALKMKDVAWSQHSAAALINEQLGLLPLTSWSEDQLLAKLKIPASYIHRCPGRIADPQIEFWMKYYGEKNLLLRLFTGVDGQTVIRGVLGRNFDVGMDDIRTIPLFVSALEATKEETKDFKVLDFIKTDTFTMLFVLFPQLTVSWNSFGVERTATSGILFANSEVGQSALHIKPMIRLNNYLDLFDNESSLVVRHSSEFNDIQFTEAIQTGAMDGQAALAFLQRLDTQEVDVKAEVENLRALPIVPRRLLNILEEEEEISKIDSKLEMARRILNSVKDMPAYQKYQITMAVGNSLGLFRDTSKRLRSVLEEDVEGIGG